MKKILLVVEDELSARKAMVEKFTHEGYEVHLASNGQEGVRFAGGIHPDLILLDILMPKMDGIQTLHSIREKDGWGKNVPVIILSNLSIEDEEKKRQIAFLNPASYLIKSDTPLSTVVERVKSIVPPSE